MAHRKNSLTAGTKVMEQTAEIGDNFKAIGRIVKDAVAEKFAEIGNGVTRFGKDRKEQAIELRDEAAALVEASPMKSVLIAIGAGFLLGRLLRR